MVKTINLCNTELRKNAKNNFENDFFKLMDNAVFEKTMENVRKDRDIKFLTTESRKNYLVFEPNYHATEKNSNNILAIEIKRMQILMNKPVYLGL